MKKAVKGTSKKTSKVGKSDVSGWVIGGQLLDTGWRVAVPIIVLSLIGIKLDSSNHTQPFYALVGLFLSLVIATFLVYKQIKDSYPDFFSRGKNKK